MGEGRREQDFGAGRVDAHPILRDLSVPPLVTFTFDGYLVQGREGEPIAASLIAAGFRILRTMPRFGGARGGFCMTGRCTDCMVVVDGVPNVRACITPVAADISVRTQRGLGDEDEREPVERRP